MKAIGNIKLNKWTFMYLAGVPIGIALGQFQGYKYGSLAFVAYHSAFLILHAAMPFVSLVEGKTTSARVQNWFIRVIFPCSAIFGWVIIGLIAFKSGF